MSACNESDLTPYVAHVGMPWNEARVKHLYNRIAYGATYQDVAVALSRNPVDLVHQLLDDAHNRPLQTPPVWADWKLGQFNQDMLFEQFYELYIEWTTTWLDYSIDFPVREKIALFWSNHLVTKFESYGVAPWVYQYHRILQQHSLGNFKTMVEEVGLSNAMLTFLNGVENTRINPNENYARELFELFTLGLDNGYTEQDIRETARALTGYNDVDYENMNITWYSLAHDNGDKTIFGETANFDYQGVMDLLFEKKGPLIAKFICAKLYRHFVNPQIDEAIVNQLAQTFLSNNFELLPVYKQMFASAHFFDDYSINTQIKSHVDYFMGLAKQYQTRITPAYGPSFIWFCGSLGQQIFDPIDVAGWKGDRAWMDSGSLLVRWLYTGWMMWTLIGDNHNIVQWIKTITNDSNDVDYVVHTIVDQFLVKGLNTASDYDNLIIAFKADIPENYFQQGLWNLDWDPDLIRWQFALLFENLKRMPEMAIG